MNSRFTLATLLFCLAFLLGLGLRAWSLGATPLSDGEANWALQALQVARAAPLDRQLPLGPQPAYTMLTGAAFAMFGSSNFLARSWPALAGSLLVLVPWLLRRPFGTPAALLLAFGLALDPGLVTVSRQAGGPLPALAFTLLALALAWNRRPWPAGLAGGLALLSGPSLLAGVLGLGLASLTAASLGLVRGLVPTGRYELRDGKPGRTSQATLLAAGATILLLGTLLFRYPAGLSAWMDTLPAYLSGWVTPSGVPALRLPAALLVFQPLAVVFALLAVGRALLRPGMVGGEDAFREDAFRVDAFGEESLPHDARSEDASGAAAYDARVYRARAGAPGPAGPPRRALVIGLALWAVAALLLAMLYPARQVADLVWVLVPLWGLAAVELVQYLPSRPLNPISLGQGGLIFVFLALFWYTLIALNNIVAPDGGLAVRLTVLVGILALSAVTTILVALGWSWAAGRDGLVWGGVAAALVYLFSALWGAAYLRFNQPQELWSASPATGQERLLLETLESLSSWKTGTPNEVDLISTVDSPALRWALRNFPNARFANQLGANEMPSALITPQDQSAPALTAAYRGQDFVWWISPGWTGSLPPLITRWLTYHEATLEERQIILWGRSDIFPGGSLPSQAPAPQP